MTALLETSTAFASATAFGGDWREVGRELLEALESVRTEGDGMNIGFVYVTNELAGDLPSLLTLLKNVTRITSWFGSTGQGICGNGVSYAGMQAAVAMIGRLPAESFHGFTLTQGDVSLPRHLTTWLSTNLPAATVMHGILSPQAALRLSELRDRESFYTVGGFTTAQGGIHVADGVFARNDDILSGVMFDSNTRIMTAASFGCVNAGPAGRITRCNGNVIETIDDKPAFQFLHDSIARLAEETQQNQNTAPGAAVIRNGNMHAGFPVPGSDQTTLLVRNITAADEQTGHIAVAHNFQRGERLQFVYRDVTTATTDLTQVLTQLHSRASGDLGAVNMKPKAILYFGCGARLSQLPDHDEAALIRKVFGAVPVAGFYTAAEICNGHVYGYTGVIVLFL